VGANHDLCKRCDRSWLILGTLTLISSRDFANNGGLRSWNASQFTDFGVMTNCTLK
jgi:hypothetical protein